MMKRTWQRGNKELEGRKEGNQRTRKEGRKKRETERKGEGIRSLQSHALRRKEWQQIKDSCWRWKLQET